ncbi:MAG: MFS transporter [Sphingorhabdus sp.]
MGKNRTEFARHWPLVMACAIGIGIGVSSLPFYTQGLFIEAWIADFGWTRAEASLGVLGSTIALAAISPTIGAAVDRYGLLKPVAFGLAGLTLSLILFALFIQSVVIFVILSVTMAVLAGASSPLAYTRAINSVFDKQRGLALGITLSGTGIGAAIAPPIVSDLISQYGWRGAYHAMALFTAIAGILIIWILSRLEGTKAPPKADAAAIKTAFKQASKTRTYWTLLSAVFLMAFGFGGLIIHFVPVLLETGIETASAARIAGIIGIAVILGRILVGAAVDRIFAPYVGAFAILCCLSGALGLAVIGSAIAMPAAFAIGFAIGAEVDLIGYLVSRYFKMAAYGRLYGRQYAAFLLGTGASPVLLGAIRDATGNYTASLFTASAILAVSAILFLTLPKFEAGPSPKA